jgi:hypothetical protein
VPELTPECSSGEGVRGGSALSYALSVPERGWGIENRRVRTGVGSGTTAVTARTIGYGVMPNPNDTVPPDSGASETPITTFSSDKEALVDLLLTIHRGKTQLPDFQRGWVWDDDHIRSLLASVTLSFPIGAVMMLETGGKSIRFKPRLVEGVPDDKVEPERLILDGQQRLTSLYLALYSGKVVTTEDQRKNPIKRWYYLDIRKALDESIDREDAIVALPEDKIVKNFRGIVEQDLSRPELECKQELFPMSVIFNQVELTKWQLTYFQVQPEQMAERVARWNKLTIRVINRVLQYQIPIIELKRDTPKVAVCQVFEKVNTGGVSLNVFELLTATFAADDYNLRDDWAARVKRFKKTKVLSSLASSDFLQAISLLATRQRRLDAITAGSAADAAPGISCKRKEILDLQLKDYQLWADPVTSGFERATRLLHALRIFDSRDLPYRTQIVPLASVLAVLGDAADSDGVRTKLARWFWCGVFGELYGGAVESRFARDVPDLLGWIEGGSEPGTITDANFNAGRLFTLRTRNSAAYKGVAAFLMREGGLDFRTGDPIDLQMYFDDKIDIHHIFPQDWCKTNVIPSQRFDCIVNKTPISAKTNRQIGGNAPSVYLSRVPKAAAITGTRMDEILSSHLIAPLTLRADNFEAFFAARSTSLLDKIEKAMGKAVAGREIPPVTGEAVDGNGEEEELDQPES